MPVKDICLGKLSVFKSLVKFSILRLCPPILNESSVLKGVSVDEVKSEVSVVAIFLLGDCFIKKGGT